MGFYKQATHRRPGDEPFLLWGPTFMTGDGPKMVHSRPKMANYGRPVNVSKGPKGIKMANLSFFIIWNPLGPSGPFYTILNENYFFAPEHHRQSLLCPFDDSKASLSELQCCPQQMSDPIQLDRFLCNLPSFKE